MDELLGRPVALNEVRLAYQRGLEKTFGVKLTLGRLSEIEMHYEQENRRNYSPEMLLARTEKRNLGSFLQELKGEKLSGRCREEV